jgi:hypothetical protein
MSFCLSLSCNVLIVYQMNLNCGFEIPPSHRCFWRVDQTAEWRTEKLGKLGNCFGMWMACHTQEEIAAACGEPIGTIGDLVKRPEFLGTVFENQSKKAAASHATDFDPPIYNIWKQQEKTAGSKHFG